MRLRPNEGYCSCALMSHSLCQGGTDLELKLVNVGHGATVFVGRIISIVPSDSSPVRRLIQDARDRGKIIDATRGRPMRSVVVCDSDHVIVSSLLADTLSARLGHSGLDTGPALVLGASADILEAQV